MLSSGFLLQHYSEILAGLFGTRFAISGELPHTCASVQPVDSVLRAFLAVVPISRFAQPFI